MSAEDQIRGVIASNPVVLFMKGTPDEPKCGFSARAVGALRSVQQNFAYVDVLSAPRIREGLPRVSQFPTFPQLFIRGELVGGSDIIAEMVQDGSLARLLAVDSTASGELPTGEGT